MSLRQALQDIERGGLVDFTFGGHSCERPQEVRQGRADDMFQISPQPDSRLLWKSNAIQVRSLKASNAASHFPWSKLESSCLDLATCLQKVSTMVLLLQKLLANILFWELLSNISFWELLSQIFFLGISSKHLILGTSFKHPLVVTKVWRLRKYTGEKCVAPAKPLWYISGDITFQKDECKRVI